MSSPTDCGSDGLDTLESIPVAAPGPRRVEVTTAAATDPGKVRANNEDHYLVARLAKSMQICHSSLKHDGPMRFSDEDGYLMVVADGMGGAAAGERASALALESVEQFTLNTLKWFLHLGGSDESVLKAELRHGLESADRAVVRQAEQDVKLAGMGTTLTMAYSVGEDLFIVHAGDSRAYLYRDGGLEQITSDHTLVQLLVTGGVLSREDAKTHRRRNVVTNVIGGPTPGVHAEIHKVRLAHDDVLLMCTDGLTEPVADAEIAAILGETRDPSQAVDRLLARALEKGGPDNVTAIVARFGIR
jgi:PPM family protein phosphatase